MVRVKTFGNTKIEFKEFDDDVWVKLTDVGKALEYSDPLRESKTLFRNNKNELEEFSRVVLYTQE